MPWQLSFNTHTQTHTRPYTHTHTGEDNYCKVLDHFHLCNYEIAIESDTFIHRAAAIVSLVKAL